MKNDPPLLALDPGIYGGYEGVELLRIWEFADQDPVKAFGAPWIELPWWLRRNMEIWLEMKAWHEVDVKAPTAAGLPSIETR